MRRVALVTGGGRGIGRGIALDLARAGWAVAIAYRTGVERAEATRAAIEAAGAPALAVAADVGDPAAAADLVRRVEATWGRLDALVHAAGPFHRIGLLDETSAGWRAMFDANLHALFDLSQAVAPGMMERRWGRILALGLASADRLAAQPNVTAYAIAKSGVLILVRSLARILAPHGITVNAISPGILDAGSAEPTELAAMLPRIPAGHVGRVEDAVTAARFLLSDEAAYVTGTNIHVSGGWGL
jgi:3-oxoacyl-[acyl-carrier protein] reductase